MQQGILESGKSFVIEALSQLEPRGKLTLTNDIRNPMSVRLELIVDSIKTNEVLVPGASNFYYINIDGIVRNEGQIACQWTYERM